MATGNNHNLNVTELVTFFLVSFLSSDMPLDNLVDNPIAFVEALLLLRLFSCLSLLNAPPDALWVSRSVEILSIFAWSVAVGLIAASYAEVSFRDHLQCRTRLSYWEICRRVHCRCPNWTDCFTWRRKCNLSLGTDRWLPERPCSSFDQLVSWWRGVNPLRLLEPHDGEPEVEMAPLLPPNSPVSHEMERLPPLESSNDANHIIPAREKTK